MPLSGNCNIDKFKLYFANTGLFVALSDEESQIDLRANKNLGVYKGALYENIVAEAFVKSVISYIVTSVTTERLRNTFYPFKRQFNPG